MSFLNPLIAAVGLGCVALPILIHILLRRRRKPMAFGAMRFLIEAYRQQRRRMRLEQWLLLALRCLLVALVAMALGKPVFDRAAALASSGPRTVYVLIDDSLASAIRSDASTLESPTALDALRAQGITILDALAPSRGDRVALISLSGPARGVILPPTSDVNVARDSLRELSPTDARADLAGAIDLVRQDIATREDSAGVSVVLLSDFRAASLSTTQALASLGEARILASTPTNLPIDNLAITAVEPLRTIVVADARSIPVRVTVSRSGPGLDAPAVARVRLRASVAGVPSRDATSAPPPPIDARFAAGQQIATALGSVDAPAQSPDARGNLRPVIIEASIDHDALAKDDVARVALQSRTTIDVAIIWPGTLGQSGGQSRGVADLTPGDWLALAAAPIDDPLAPRRASGVVRLFVLDPTRDLTGPTANTALRGVDAVFVPAPDALAAPAWSALRAAADAGALVIVSPPSGEVDPAWTTEFSNAFDIRATIAPAPITLDLPTRAATPPSTGVDLLSMIAGELPELLRPVTISRYTPITGPAGTFDALLTLESGEPILAALATGGTRSDTNSTTPRANASGNAANSGPNSGPSSGLVLFLGVAPDLAWTDMPAKPLMVPLVQELLRQGVGRAMMTRVATAGSRVTLDAREGELIVLPLTVDDSRAGQLLDSAAPIRTAGLYAVRTSDAATARVIVVNPDTAASVTDTLSADTVQRALATVAPTVEFLAPQAAPTTPTSPTTPGAPTAAPTAPAGPAGPAGLSPESTSPPISYPLLIAAGVIALLELILARLFSHATLPAATKTDSASPTSPATAST
jgi:hypothetical protein